MKYTKLKDIASNKEIIASAKVNLAGKWGKAALTLFIFTLIPVVEKILDKGSEYSINWFLGAGIDILGALVITTALLTLTMIVFSPLYALSVPRYFIALNRGIELSRGDCIKHAFVRIGSWCFTGILAGLIIFGKTLLLIVPGILAGYDYMFGYWCLADDPELGARDALRRSRALVYGHRWQAFCLLLRLACLGFLVILAFALITVGIMLLAVLSPLVQLLFLLLLLPGFLVAVLFLATYFSTVISRFYLELLPEENEESSAVLPPKRRSFTVRKRFFSAVAGYVCYLIFGLAVAFTVFYAEKAMFAAEQCDTCTGGQCVCGND